MIFYWEYFSNDFFSIVSPTSHHTFSSSRRTIDLLLRIKAFSTIVTSAHWDFIENNSVFQIVSCRVEKKANFFQKASVLFPCVLFHCRTVHRGIICIENNFFNALSPYFLKLSTYYWALRENQSNFNSFSKVNVQ